MRGVLFFILGALGLATLCLSAAAQTRQGAAARRAPASPHGDPQGWRFKLPADADATRGRAAFEKFECYKCHEVKGEKFAAPSQRDAIGPELRSMVGHHSVGFLAESIVNPSAFVDEGQGYTAADGTSKMPSFNDSMTVQELVDVLAYLKSLAPSTPAAPGRHRH